VLTNPIKTAPLHNLKLHKDLKIVSFGNHDQTGDLVHNSLMKQSADLYILLGNYSYDVNDEMGIRGDSYFMWMESILTKAPVILTPGNHENYLNTEFFNNRFMMPGTRKPIDNNFFAVESHHLQLMSLNFDYLMINSGLEDMIDLLLVKVVEKFKKRNDKHFTVFFSHRPFHCKLGFDECVKLTNDYQSIYNHLHDIKVNLNLWGHVQHYERLPPIYGQQVVDSSNMFSLIIGTADNKQDTKSSHFIY